MDADSTFQPPDVPSSYDELQSIDLLHAARDSWRNEAPSRVSSLRAILQSIEIGLYNLADLTRRAGSDIHHGLLGRAAAKTDWIRAFHRLLTELGALAGVCGLEEVNSENPVPLAFQESPALARYLEAVREFDSSMVALLGSGLIEQTLVKESLDSTLVRIIHNTQISCHEAAIWERTLAGIRTNEIEDYSAFVASEILLTAIQAMRGEPDSFLMQFRALHQMPELLAFEANERLEASIRSMRDEAWLIALRHLQAANQLVAGIVRCLPPLVDCLCLSDYHRIRSHLGVTSGSHSIALRYRLGRDLYEQIAEEVHARSGLHSRPDWVWPLLESECLRLRGLILQWREWHLHLPRLNLGEATRSLAGSKDSVATVQAMRLEAIQKDPMQDLATRYGSFQPPQGGPAELPLDAYFNSAESLDHKLLTIAGSLTRFQFKDVQERTGRFNAPAKFAPPPKKRL